MLSNVWNKSQICNNQRGSVSGLDTKRVMYDAESAITDRGYPIDSLHLCVKYPLTHDYLHQGSAHIYVEVHDPKRDKGEEYLAGRCFSDEVTGILTKTKL